MRSLVGAAVWALAMVAVPAGVGAQTLRLEDGRLLQGAVAATAGIAENPNSPSPQAGEIAVQPIYVIDDELRRVFISKRKVAEVLDQTPERLATIPLWQDVATAGGHLSSIGPSLGISRFDEYGRRTYRMQTASGPLAVVQGITELTPRYAKVEALRGSRPRNVVWDMRLKTSSIPQTTLSAILARGVPQDDPQQRLKVVRFYVDAERYSHARRELERVLEDFPDLTDLEMEVKQLRQMGARRILTEIRMRREAGQHALVRALLDNFPAEEVAGETLAEVRELTGEYDRMDAKIEQIKALLTEAVAMVSDPDDRSLAGPLVAEITAELSHNNYERLAPFAQLADDKSLGPDQRVALALTGWLLGAADAQDQLAIGIALIKIRSAVLNYLREGDPVERQALLADVRTLDGADVASLAKLIAHMKPPFHEEQFTSDSLGAYSAHAKGITEDGDFQYHVQLPPEYDPYRRYPTIVALNGAYMTPEHELDFWAGGAPLDPDGNPTGRRNGQAGRHGYIVVAVDWLKMQQYTYEHSVREHLAVLTCLRDAGRKWNIDSDRVFLAGHGIGGDAAWDLAQAHPDLWAGVIPVAARGVKYVRHYWENAKFVPWYFVAGEKDGQSVSDNAVLWDKYVRKLDFDATVVEYQGRGHESFHDEIIYLFDWMGRRARKEPPREFICRTMRPWDNFFWWIECRDFDDKWMIHPAEWNDRRVGKAAVNGKIRNDNRLLVETVSNSASIWLNPDVVDFSKPIRLTVNGRKVKLTEDRAGPDALVLLEDVRTRGDRQRPFWAKIEWP